MLSILVCLFPLAAIAGAALACRAAKLAAQADAIANRKAYLAELRREALPGLIAHCERVSRIYAAKAWNIDSRTYARKADAYRAELAGAA